MSYELFEQEGRAPVKAWTRGVVFEDQAKRQVFNAASLPFIHHHIAVMADVHAGIGATVGSVIPTKGAIVPAAVGVDIGCGVDALRTTLRAEHLPDHLGSVRAAIESAVPHGRTDNGGPNDRGAWGDPPARIQDAWHPLSLVWRAIAEKHPKLQRGASMSQLGTLGTGNHFVEVCLDETDRVWVMLHSGSRGVGNRVGSYFIERAKEHLGERLGTLPDKDLAWLDEGTETFTDYVTALRWAQDYARVNRREMLHAAFYAMCEALGRADVQYGDRAISCHHNYVAKETHFGERVWVTRKGAVRARPGELGIIPGAMGRRSYIVRGKGNPDSFESCSHGAGRVMSRTQARKTISLEDHARETAGLECRKDAEVLDESPAAYKDIDHVMAAQADLVEVVHTLHAVVCVKG